MKEYRICWQSKTTGKQGTGEWLRMAYPSILEMGVRTLNKMWPDLDHWIEEREAPNDHT